MTHSVKASVHEGVPARLHHPQLLQSCPNLVSVCDINVTAKHTEKGKTRQAEERWLSKAARTCPLLVPSESFPLLKTQ